MQHQPLRPLPANWRLAFGGSEGHRRGLDPLIVLVRPSNLSVGVGGIPSGTPNHCARVTTTPRPAGPPANSTRRIGNGALGTTGAPGVTLLRAYSISPGASRARRHNNASPPCVTFRLVVAPLRGPGRSPVLPFACCVGSLLSVGRCGRCSCWCRFRVRGAQWLACWDCPPGASRARRHNKRLTPPTTTHTHTQHQQPVACLLVFLQTPTPVPPKRLRHGTHPPLLCATPQPPTPGHRVRTRSCNRVRSQCPHWAPAAPAPHGLHRLLSNHSAFGPRTTSAVNGLANSCSCPVP